MSQQFSTTEDPWRRIPEFYYDGVRVRVSPYAGSDHSAATTVFTSKNNAEVFHADKYCHRLHASEPYRIDGKSRRTIHARTLETVLTSWLNPIRPCDYCTQDIGTTADIATEIDGVPEGVLKFYEPGDRRVNEQWTRADSGEWQLSNRTETEVYE